MEYGSSDPNDAKLAPGIGTYMKGSEGNYNYRCGAVRGSVGLGVRPLMGLGEGGTMVFMARVRVAHIPNLPKKFEDYDDTFPELNWEYNSGHHMRTHLRCMLQCATNHEQFAEGVDEAAHKIASYISEQVAGSNYQVMFEHLRDSWLTAISGLTLVNPAFLDPEAECGAVVNYADPRSKKVKVLQPVHFHAKEGQPYHGEGGPMEQAPGVLHGTYVIPAHMDEEPVPEEDEDNPEYDLDD